MKATIDVPDDLYRRVKAKSALEGRPIRAVAIELLTAWVEGRTTPEPSGEDESSPRHHKDRPAWFASLRKYARPGLSHDIEVIRRSIERGLREEHRSQSAEK